MSKSNHRDYLKVNEDKFELIRPMDWPLTKYEILCFKRYEYTSKRIEEIGNLIKENLTDSLITHCIKKKYPLDHPRWERELFGYCVPATFVLLFFMNTEFLHPVSGTDPDGENHWWLEDIITNQRFDLTAAQYSRDELKFVYDTGRRTKLYSFKGRPQSRFMDLMQSVQPNSKRWTTDDLIWSNKHKVIG